jgi:hypothetical protein
MKIRKALFAELKKWHIEIWDDEKQFISGIAIPPTKNNRIDVFLEIREGDCIKRQYLYDFKGNLKKLKGEKIIITIKNGKIEIELKN